MCSACVCFYICVCVWERELSLWFLFSLMITLHYFPSLTFLFILGLKSKIRAEISVSCFWTREAWKWHCLLMGIFSYLNAAQASSPEGKAASHLQSLIVFCFFFFSCGSSHSPERGRLIPGGNKHSITLSPNLANPGHHIALLTLTTRKNSPFPSSHPFQVGHRAFIPARPWFDNWDLNLLLKSPPRPLQNGLYWECCALLWDINPFPAAFSLDETLSSDERTRSWQQQAQQRG